MLDLARLQRIHPRPRPLAQRLAAELVILFDYWSFRRTKVVIEGLQRIPRDRPVFLAMNHTDRFNYLPFLCCLHRHGLYCATWVKGKYYEHRLPGAFMDLTNQVPLPSWGYLLSSRFRKATGRKPRPEEYEALAALSRGAAPPAGLSLPDLSAYFGPGELSAAVDQTYRQMMIEVLRINQEALDQGLHILVFPQGTRSIRLSRGHTGMVQVANHLGRSILPIGCMGADRLYPGDSPFSKGGTCLYRVGEPLSWDAELSPFRVREPYVPLTREASRAHGQRFQAATDLVMDRINDLLDPAYQYNEDRLSDGVQGVDRFL